MRKPTLTSDPPFDDRAVASTALEIGLNRYLALFSELHHESRFDAIGGSDWLTTEPTVMTLGATVRTPVGIHIQGGFSTGLMDREAIPVEYQDPDEGGINNFSQKSATDFSMYLHLSWAGPLTSQDADGDGIKDDVDRCPRQPEDKDGFQDSDGCPDPDNDQDGVEDKKDKCPLQGEDMDGFQDQDGCPDPDNDQDGVPDASDKCPMDAMGDEGKDGCPNTDKDGDGIKDGDDKCPLGAEDKDGFEDEDGCPELDNDRDGIADADDKCPNAPETINQFEDEDGCPDKIQVKEVIKTMILKGVNFRTGSSDLTAESFSVLDGVATQLNEAPKTVFEISGHTDSRGSAAKNQELSQSRAQTVANYFISKGIDPKRLRVMGYGPARPIATNNTAEGRAMNRRVELNRVD
jgi:outer membrane protein OmpA-like peptidoglycan-associated protein